VAIIAAAASIVFVAGTLSEVVLGDEPYHFTFARAWADAGVCHRPVHHPLYASGEAGWVTHPRRRLTPSQQAVFEYLRTETPADARVIYPGEVLVAQAKRQAVWSQLRDPETGAACITGFLREKQPEKVWAILDYNAVTYVCVDPTWVYRDGAQVVGFGYPESFVKRLATFPFLERVAGDWPGIELWKVKGVPAEAGSRPGGGGAPDDGAPVDGPA